MAYANSKLKKDFYKIFNFNEIEWMRSKAAHQFDLIGLLNVVISHATSDLIWESFS